MKSVLVLGASGLLGREVYRICKEATCIRVIGTCNSRKDGELKYCDVCDENELRSLLLEEKPDIVVNCIAIRFPDIVEKDPIRTKALNGETTNLSYILVDFPQRLAIACNEMNTLLIHISTDYVFDGTSWPYKPLDVCNPLNKYGQSKRDSELVVMQSCKQYLIIRIPILYGPGAFEESAVMCLYNRILRKEECYVDHIAKRIPTLTTDIAVTICNYITTECPLRGIVHISAEKEYTKYEMIQLMGELTHQDISHIHPQVVDNSVVKRPFNCHLDCSELKNAGVFVMREFVDGLEAVFRQEHVIE